MFTFGLSDTIVHASKWFGGLLASLILVWAAYLRGKRAKIDDIRLRRKYDLAERLAVRLQADNREREWLLGWYHRSFDHLPDLDTAMHYFHKHANDHKSIQEAIGNLAKGIIELVSLRQEAAVYLPSNLLKAVDTYEETTRFTHETDGGLGIYDTYFRNFFETLLDEDRTKRRLTAFKRTISGLSKLRG